MTLSVSFLSELNGTYDKYHGDFFFVFSVIPSCLGRVFSAQNTSRNAEMPTLKKSEIWETANFASRYLISILKMELK